MVLHLGENFLIIFSICIAVLMAVLGVFIKSYVSLSTAKKIDKKFEELKNLAKMQADIESKVSKDELKLQLLKYSLNPSVKGLGAWLSIKTALGEPAVLLPGGTWAWAIVGISSHGVVLYGFESGISAGGTTIRQATKGVRWTGFQWRIR